MVGVSAAAAATAAVEDKKEALTLLEILVGGVIRLHE